MKKAAGEHGAVDHKPTGPAAPGDRRGSRKVTAAWCVSSEFASGSGFFSDGFRIRRQIRPAPGARRNPAWVFGGILPLQQESLPRRNRQPVIYTKPIGIKSANVTFKICAAPTHPLESYYQPDHPGDQPLLPIMVDTRRYRTELVLATCAETSLWNEVRERHLPGAYRKCATCLYWCLKTKSDVEPDEVRAALLGRRFRGDARCVFYRRFCAYHISHCDLPCRQAV